MGIEVDKADITINLAYAPPLPINPENSSHHHDVALPFSRYQKTVAKPSGMAFVSEPPSLGAHIRKKRRECKLTQSDLAQLCAVDVNTITQWELGKYSPLVQYYPAIIAFLGYYPFDHETDNIGGKLKQLRYCNGYSLEQCAVLLEVDHFTVRNWEHYSYLCPLPMHERILFLWSQIPDNLKQQYHL
jgi:DNA-binding XRE family transcriptional regulator